jgi:integrase
MKLDSKTVSALALPAGKTDVIHFDSALPGFGFRVRLGAGGVLLKSWVCQYKRGGSTRRLLLGNAAVLGAEAARKAAQKALGKVANGEDPQAERAERRDKDKLSLKSMIDEYLLHKRAQVGKRQHTEIQRYLSTGPYLKPLFSMPVDKVTRRDIASRLVVVTREHSSTVAARTRAALSAFFVWAMQSGIAETNPVIGTLTPREGASRDRVLSDVELAAIWRACQDDAYGKIIKLLICTGCRRQEIGGIAWSEIDLDRATWTLPARRSKNGRKHELPLLSSALDIIKSVPHRVSRDQLFGERARGFTSWARNKPVLDQRADVSGWTIHDIRRSVATRMADIGIAPHIIEEILNHVSGHKAGPAGIYNRSVYEREVKAALALWSDHIRALVDGGERKVLSFPPPPAAI